MFLSKRSAPVVEETAAPFNPPRVVSTSLAQSSDAAGCYVGTLDRVPRAWFSSLYDNPWQRDTERHAPKIAPLLRKSLPAHSEVKVVFVAPNRKAFNKEVALLQTSGSVYVSGGVYCDTLLKDWLGYPQVEGWRVYKLEGHTKDFIFNSADLAYKDIPRPAAYRVVFYACASEDLKQLYDAENSRASVKTSGDDLASEAHHAEFDPQSAYLTHSTFLKGLEMAERVRLGLGYVNDSRLPTHPLPNWVDVLRVADQILLKHGSPYGGLFAGMLLTLRKYPQEAPEFWKEYFERTAEFKTAPTVKLRSAITALEGGFKSRETRARAAEITIKAFETWRRYGKDARIKSLKASAIDGYLE